MAVYDITANPALNTLSSFEKAKGVFDWDVKKQVELTVSELNALKVKHVGYTPNLQRALRVKRLMLEKYSLSEIIKILRPNGRGYGERMLKKDHSALNGK